MEGEGVVETPLSRNLLSFSSGVNISNFFPEMFSTLVK